MKRNKRRLDYVMLLLSDGEIGYHGNVMDAYMKQKHRMIFERRHGPVGGPQALADSEELLEKEGSMLEKLRNSFGRSGSPPSYTGT